MGRKEKVVDILERVPPAISALVTVVSVILGGAGAYWSLRMQDAIHDEKIGKLEHMTVRADRDHDILAEVNGKVSLILQMLERSQRADAPASQGRPASIRTGSP